MMTIKKDEWLRIHYQPSLQKNGERRSRFDTTSRIPIEPVYTEENLSGWLAGSRLGFPGLYPFTRGIYPSMYRSRLWTMRQYAGFGTAAETNRRFLYLLEQGQTGLSVAFDLPTQIGFDSDHPLAEGEVGRVGVAIDSLRDMEVLFDGIPLDRVSTSMTINATAIILFCMYLAVARKKGIAHNSLSGTLQNDILKEYVARGTYIYPPQPSLRLVFDVIEFAVHHVPRWNPISISGYHIREAGATAVQELAFTLANGIAYVNGIHERNLDLDKVGARLSFFFSAHNHFFEEIAKFRAARRMWAQIMKERFGVRDERAMMLRFHTQTAGSTLTYQSPEINIIRVAYQALAAVLGGTQSLHTNAYDEALGLPTESSALLALRTQQVLAEETGVADTVDPLGGSYFIETLTEHLESAARDYLKRIDDLGGVTTAIESHYLQKEIQQAAYRYQQGIENREIPIIGVNLYPGSEQPPEPFRPDPQTESDQKQRLRELRRTRNRRLVRRVLRDLKSAAARPNTNLVPVILNAVEAEATLGEIADTLREVFGEFEDSGTL